MASSNFSWVLNETDNFDSLILTEKPIPEPKEGEVLVKLECSVINSSDILSIKGLYNRPETPLVAGLKGTGTVQKSGGGDLADSLVHKRVAFATSGTWCEFTLVKAEMAYEILDSTSFEFATTICYNPLTVLNIVDYIKTGKHPAFIHNAAASALGKQLVRYTKSLGINGIHIVRREEQVKILQDLGAEFVFNSSEDGWFEKAKNLAQQIQATVGFDALGGNDTNIMAQLLLDGGNVFTYGCISCKDPVINAKELVFRFKKLEGLYVIPWFHKKSSEERKEILRFVQENQEIFATEFAHEVTLTGVKDALTNYQERATDNKYLIRNRMN